MELRDFVETGKVFYKMGFSITKTTLDLLKVASDSYISMYELYLRQMLPSESFESVKKALNAFAESQSKVFESFRKMLEQMEKQQDEIINRFTEFLKPPAEKKK